MIGRKRNLPAGNRSIEDLGRLIARAHYQAWRLDAPPFDLTPEELAAILPSLIKSGSAGIVWHRVKPLREKYGAMAYALEAATEAQIAHNQRVEEAVVECVTRLRAYGIEPVLVKGLALAKLYPKGIVRPAGDIDLVVRKDEFAAAHAILHDRTKPPIAIAIDLKHPSIWEEVPNTEFWDRLASQDIGSSSVSCLSRIDNIQMVCYHFLKHGGQRPLWLCDFILLLDDVKIESLNVALSSLQRSWHHGLASVATSLVGPSRSDAVLESSGPDWMIANVFNQWLKPREVIRGPALTRAIQNPKSIPGIVREVWPTPIAATFWQSRHIAHKFDRSTQAREYGRRFKEHLQDRSLSQLRNLA